MIDNEKVRHAAARLLIFGFDGKKVNAHAKKLLDLEDPLQVFQLCTELKSQARSQPLLIMVDQEGGRVSRLGPPFTSLPSAELIGLTNDFTAASAVATVLARELSAVNIDMDLAPVVDVATNPDNPVIGNRSYGQDASTVVAMSKAFVKSMQGNGIACCAKHFPGHGDTSVDSHLQLPLLSHDLERLKKVELPPFYASIEADVAAIMVAHVSCPVLNTRAEDNGRPASLSKGPVSFLRNKMKFNGVIVTDCLEMGAIVNHFTVEEAAVLALEAGVDCVMVCHTEKRQCGVIEAIVEAVLQGRLSFERLSESIQRLDRLNERFGVVSSAPNRPKKVSLDVIGCKEHQSIASDVVHQAASFEHA